MKCVVMAVTIVAGLCTSVLRAQTARWPEQKANAWYARQPWLVGSNYVPKSAINQLEMWQEARFDPAQIETEVACPAGMGRNTMRVFLLHWARQKDAVGFLHRTDLSLRITSRAAMRPLPDLLHL